MNKLKRLIFASILAFTVAPALFLGISLFKGLGEVNTSSTTAKEEIHHTKSLHLGVIEDDIQIKSETTGWVSFSNAYAHYSGGIFSFDDNETDAIAQYDQDLSTLTIYNTGSNPIIDSIKASGELDLKIVFERNYDEDHLISFELDCDSVELTSYSSKYITVSYLLANDLIISGDLEFNVTFFKDDGDARKYFNQSIEPPHNAIIDAKSFNLIDNASFDGTTLYNLSAVSELLTPGYFSLFSLGKMTINTEGYFKAGIASSRDSYPTDYANTLNITEMPHLIKCGQDFIVTGKNDKVTNLNQFNNEFLKSSKHSTYYVNFRHFCHSPNSGLYQAKFVPAFHSTDIKDEQIILWNENIRKNYSNYHPIGLTYENGVVTLAEGCTYSAPIEVESINNRKVDITIKFEKGYYGQKDYYLSVLNTYGNITLTTTGDEEAHVFVACVGCTGSLIIKGNLNVSLMGMPTYNHEFPLQLGSCGMYGYYRGFITGEERIVVEGNASLNTANASMEFNNGEMRLIYANRLIVTTNNKVDLGSYAQAIAPKKISALYLEPSSTRHNEIDDYRLIRNQNNIEGAEFNIYRYKGNYNTYSGTSSNLGKLANDTGTSYIIPEDESKSVEVATFTSNSTIANLSNHTVSFVSNEGSGSMDTVTGLTAHTFYELPECGFTAPSYKVFKGWSFTGKDPSIIKQPGELIDIQNDDFEIYPVWEDTPIPALTGSVTINGTLKYGETLTSTVTDSNNSGTLSYQWRRNGLAIEEATNSTYVVTEEDIGYSLSVYVTSDIELGSITGTTLDIIEKAEAHAPIGISATACATASNNDGTISGVSSIMEYKLSSGSDWTPGTGETINNLVPGTYYVRYKETSTHNASENATVIVNAYNTPIKYSVTVNGGTADLVSIEEGTLVTITANAPEVGKVFTGWSSTDGITFEDVNAITTTFVMPNKNVTVTASYGGESIPTVLESISLSGTYKNSFEVGDMFSYEGLVVTAHYNNKADTVIHNGYSVSTPDISIAGTKTVTISYTEEEVTKTATYQITVNEKGASIDPGSETPVDPEPVAPGNNGLPAGAIAGIVIGSVLVLGIGGFALVWFVIKKKTWADFIAIFKKK